MSRSSREPKLFWDNFRRAYPVKAVALMVVVALTVVSCGKEAGISQTVNSLSYDTLPPAKAINSQRPAERLHADASKLSVLLTKQARASLTSADAEIAMNARAGVTEQLAALAAQFTADKQKLQRFNGDAALKRLELVETKFDETRSKFNASLSAAPTSGARAAGAAVAAELLNELSPEKPPQPTSSDLSFGVSNATPRAVSLSAGITPAYNAPNVQASASSLPREPQPADLATVEETAPSADLDALAAELEHDPVKIYEFVRNNVRFQPYWGIRKGADQTLAEKSGSDADQAALLITLLRRSGVHARYLQGTVELRAEKAASWLGVDVATGDRLDAIPEILASGGIPISQVRVGGELSKVRFGHFWVEAYVASDAYRGVNEDDQSKRWMPLDPSLKGTSFKRPIADFAQLMSAATDDWAQSFVDESDVLPGSAMVGPSSAQMQASTGLLMHRAESVFQHAGIDDDSTLEDVIGSTSISRSEATYLPASTPFRALGIDSEMRSIPDALKSSVNVEVSGSDPLSMPESTAGSELDQSGVRFSAPTHALANKRMTLAYAPATATDSEIIDSYHGLLNAPSYASALVPVLRVDGRIVARGRQGVSTGYSQKFTLTYKSPGFNNEVVENPVSIGSVSAIVLNLGRPVAEQSISRAQAHLAAIETRNIADTLITDAGIGESLSLLGASYFMRNDSFDNLLAQSARISRQRQLSGAILATNVDTAYLAGFPVATRLSGLNIDVDHDVQSVVTRAGPQSAISRYFSTSSMHASSSESAIFEDSLKSQSVSTAQIFDVARRQRIPLHAVTSQNIESVLSSSTLKPTQRLEIQESISRGATTVVVPDREITVGGWTGIGFMVLGEGSADYRIFGGTSGGLNTEVSAPAAVPLAAGTIDASVISCFSALDDLGDAANLGASALFTLGLFTTNIVSMGPLLALSASPFWPVAAALLIAFVVYLVLQALSDWSDCVEGGSE